MGIAKQNTLGHQFEMHRIFQVVSANKLVPKVLEEEPDELTNFGRNSPPVAASVRPHQPSAQLIPPSNLEINQSVEIAGLKMAKPPMPSGYQESNLDRFYFLKEKQIQEIKESNRKSVLDNNSMIGNIGPEDEVNESEMFATNKDLFLLMQSGNKKPFQYQIKSKMNQSMESSVRQDSKRDKIETEVLHIKSRFNEQPQILPPVSKTKMQAPKFFIHQSTLPTTSPVTDPFLQLYPPSSIQSARHHLPEQVQKKSVDHQDHTVHKDLEQVQIDTDRLLQSLERAKESQKPIIPSEYQEDEPSIDDYQTAYFGRESHAADSIGRMKLPFLYNDKFKTEFGSPVQNRLANNSKLNLSQDNIPSMMNLKSNSTVLRPEDDAIVHSGRHINENAKTRWFSLQASEPRFFDVPLLKAVDSKASK